MRKHPEVHDKKKDLMKTYGLPDFSKLKSCSSDGKCDKDKKCCETPCGMKCMQPVFGKCPYGDQCLSLFILAINVSC